MWAFLLLGALSAAAFGQIGLVLYSSGLALVEEIRPFSLAREGVLELRGFPAETLWETLAVEGLELVALRPLPRESWTLNKFVGQEVTVQTQAGAFRGILRAVLSEGLVLATEEGTVLVREYLWVRGPKTDPLSETQALLHYRTEEPGEKTVRLRYLARGFAWKITYEAELEGSELRLGGRAWIQNVTGVDFPRASLVLIAGEVQAPRGDAGLRALAMAPEAVPTEAFEYHRYDLPGPWDVPQGQLAIPLVRTTVPARKTYRLSGQRVEVYVRFTADTVLPGGEMRVYAEGIFVGADTLSHTLPGKEVELRVGTAFDLSGQRQQVRRERLGENLFRETWRITLSSAKKEDVEVEVVETLSGYWRILSSTLPYEILDAQRIKFVVPVPKEGQTLLEYTVEWRY